MIPAHDIRTDHRLPKKPRKYRRMMWKERLILAVTAVSAASLCTVMVLHMKLFPVTERDEHGSVYQTHISLMQKLRNWQPFLGAEPALDSGDYVLLSDTDMPAECAPAVQDDGLDLDQRIEGQFTVLFLGMDETRSNTDVIMLAMFDIRANSIRILQIPRDTFVPGFTSFEACKLNSVYTCGNPNRQPVQRVAECLEAVFRIPIDRYITVGCGEIAEMTDLIGGVPVNMPYRIVYEAGKVIESGEQVLSGEQAEWLVRFRHDYTEGDIGRIKAQRIFMAAAAEKAASLSSLEQLRVIRSAVTKQLIRSDLSVDELRKLADLAAAAGMEHISVYLLPGEGTRYQPPIPQSDIPFYSVWTMHRQPVIDLLNRCFRPYTEQDDNLPIAELLTPDQYQCTRYDGDCSDFQSIENGSQFTGY